MPSAEIPSTHHDLLDSATAILATVGPDGRPQLSAVWFLKDGEAVKISLNSTRQKLKNLRANPAVTFFILDPNAATRYLEVRGDAEIDDDQGYVFADRVGAKYGMDMRNFDGPNGSRVIVTIHPTRVNAVDMAAGA
ncbi:MAG TPA: PPOX class F420-dependent oxidoreductase [Acidimicrobiales bacterium]